MFVILKINFNRKIEVVEYKNNKKRLVQGTILFINTNRDKRQSGIISIIVNAVLLNVNSYRVNVISVPFLAI